MVHLTEVSKYFGEKRALGPVSFEIPRGSTVGFLGRNGVGKTTLLRVLACDLRPSAGAVRVGGMDALSDPHEVRKLVGYLPENPPLYGDMTVRDYLAFVGRIKGVAPADLARRVADVEERTAITHVDGELTRNLSHGYRQRVGIAQAIIHEPELLILDEPTNGLDPMQIVGMRDLVDELKDSHTILISSHILPEISETCDRILILDSGEIIASGSEDELSTRLLGSNAMVVAVARPEASADHTGPADVAADRTEPAEPADPAADVAVERSDPSSRIEGLIASVPDVVVVRRLEPEAGTLVFGVEAESDCRAVVCRTLIEAGYDVVHLDRQRRELERLFVELVGEVEA